MTRKVLKRVLQVEELERKDAPSCLGLETAVSSPGADHRSEVAAHTLVAVQVAHDCIAPPIGSVPRPGGGGDAVNHNETFIRDRARARRKGR